MTRQGGTAGGLGRRRLLGLGVASAVGVAGALLPAADRYGSHLAAVATGADAIARLQTAVTAFLATTQILELDGQTWTFDRLLLGLSVTLETMTEAGNHLPFTRPPLVLSATVDQAALNQAVTAIPNLEQSPVDARLILDGVVATVMPDQPGRTLDTTTLTTTLIEQAQRLDDSSITVPMLVVPAATTAATLMDRAAWLDRILGHPLAFVDTPASISLSAEAVATTLRVEPGGTVTTDRDAWERLLEPLAAAVALEPIEPTLSLDGGRAEVKHGRPGRVLDMAATIDATWAALQAERPAVAPVLRQTPARATAADLAPAVAIAGRLLTRPPVLVAGDTLYPLTTTDLQRLIHGSIDVDPAAADSLWKLLAVRVDTAPRPPLYRWRDGQAVADSDGLPGLRLDRDAALGILTAGLRSGAARIHLPVVATQPSGPPEGLEFPDLLAEGSTYYADSVRERYANVALGLERIGNVLVPPGGTFSFNQASGPVTYATGFQRGYGIAMTNGQVTTLPSVGGGICQVATTVFHAVFRAGLPIANRSWHLYWMPRYGRAPSGMIGLDATVDDQVGLDFTFVNSTAAWLLVETTSEAGNAIVRLRGVDPGWQVSITGPFISNVVRASQTMLERKDPSLRRGSRVWVEHAEDGKTVSIKRTVQDANDEVLEERTFVSHYAPAANVTLVGTG